MVHFLAYDDDQAVVVAAVAVVVVVVVDDHDIVNLNVVNDHGVFYHSDVVVVNVHDVSDNISRLMLIFLLVMIMKWLTLLLMVMLLTMFHVLIFRY